MTNTTQYSEDNIRHLSDMEHIRTRPGMYIGRLSDGSQAEDGIYVLLKEVIDNSIDEFKMGAGKRIEVDIEENLRVTVRDYGRGIPLGKLVEAVSMLNTGGKYDSKAFQKSVGLNGVGLKAVNALSTRFEVQSFRDGQTRRATFSKGILEGDTTEPTQDENGTAVFFEPDASLFKHYAFRSEFVEVMLRNYTYLNTGLTIMFNGRRIISRDGLSDLLSDRMDYEPLYPIIHLRGEDIEVAFTHTKQNGEEYYSFVNGQNTTLGGTHQAAFKKYIAEVIKDYSGKNYEYTDIRNGMVAAISINIQEPLFESQTKVKLGSTTTEPGGGISIDKFIGDFVKEQVDNYLHKNTDVADIILQKVAESEKLRKEMAGVAKKAREMSKKANLHNRKLRDCRVHLSDTKGEQQEESSIFITEGDSASGSERGVQPAAGCPQHRRRTGRTALQQGDCRHRCRRRRHAYPPAHADLLPEVLPRPGQEGPRLRAPDTALPRPSPQDEGGQGQDERHRGRAGRPREGSRGGRRLQRRQASAPHHPVEGLRHTVLLHGGRAPAGHRRPRAGA